MLPKLKRKVEKAFPNHQQRIDGTLNNFGLHDWKVIITMGKPGSGYLYKSTHWIILGAGTKRQMLTTLYHEIFHYKCPEALENEIEEMGKVFYKLITERCLQVNRPERPLSTIDF